MLDRRTLVLSAAAALMAGAALAADIPAHVSAAVADAGRPEAERSRDAARKPAETLIFAGVQPGSKVGELMPGSGYFTRILSKAVGPSGKIYAFIPSAMPDRLVQSFDPVAKDPAYGNVTVLRQTYEGFAPPESLDLVWTSRNYHDMHNNGQNPAPLNAAIFKALKPGGVYLVLDHAAAAGSGLSATNTLHRIDPAVVKAEVTKVGFKFDGESTALIQADDDRTKGVRELPDKTSQFVYRFKKPK